MNDDADGIWTLTLPSMPGTIEYKFTLDGWNYQENLLVVLRLPGRPPTAPSRSMQRPLCPQCVGVLRRVPEISDVLSCMDDSANNYNPDATVEPENSYFTT